MPHLVVTSISAPNDILRAQAEGAATHGWKYVVVGDRKSPKTFHLPGCEFVGVERELPFAFARVCRENSYTRKNLGYLLAMSEGAEVIVETDDDNLPLDEFWGERSSVLSPRTVSGQGWVNAYRYFAEDFCYPRGLPLQVVRSTWDSFSPINATNTPTHRPTIHSPIQQGLADGHPDVDAIYRMLYPGEIFFENAEALALGIGQWCPFNSQNTTWFPEAYPLLYLPTTCSFRMTDIWRSFVAQRVLWERGWSLGFHGATVRQIRNEHDPLSDFRDEISGYLKNAQIIRTLENLSLGGAKENLTAQLFLCYQALVESEVLPQEELDYLEAWQKDIDKISTKQ